MLLQCWHSPGILRPLYFFIPLFAGVKWNASSTGQHSPSDKYIKGDKMLKTLKKSQRITLISVIVCSLCMLFIPLIKPYYLQIILYSFVQIYFLILFIIVYKLIKINKRIIVIYQCNETRNDFACSCCRIEETRKTEGINRWDNEFLGWNKQASYPLS